MKFLGSLASLAQKGTGMTVDAYLKPAYHENDYCRKFAMAEIAETVADMGDLEAVQGAADETSHHLLWMCLGRDLAEFNRFKLKPYYAAALAIIIIAFVASSYRRVRQKTVGGVTPSSLLGVLCCVGIVMCTYASVDSNWRHLLFTGGLLALGAFIPMVAVYAKRDKTKKPSVITDGFLNRPAAMLWDLALGAAIASAVGAAASGARVKTWEAAAKLQVVNPLANMTQGAMQYAM